MLLVPSLGVAAPLLLHDRRHDRRSGRDNGRGRRSGRRSRSRAGSQSKSRNQSGSAERPASRDKTHVSPPRVESDTLYQPDTQSRAVQDLGIITPSRLFSMANRTLNRRMTTILIFGAAVRPGGEPSQALRRRVEAAIHAGRSHPGAHFVATGAVGRYGPSEASIMAQLLMKSGIEREKIILEETGRDTLSSVRAIRRILLQPGFEAPILVATSAYHLPRCLTLLCLSGIAAHRCSPPSGVAATDWRKRWYWRAREIPALPYDAFLVLWLRLFRRL